ncbi:MAG: HlyD family efflux transporter periplasmic adaptor subunit, partial [Duncaniella sp.]|nr:HlyD family efflux transporter periplasmic adaptor subunit [Duncaniella sp.]
MDRELTQTERWRIRRKRMLHIIIGVCSAITAGIILFSLMQPTVRRDKLIFAKVDTGTIETSVTGAGSVVPAFEEILNSPINSRVMEVYCKAGDTVDVSTPLLRLDLQSTETDLDKLTDQIQMKRHELDRERINSDTHLKDLAMQIRVKEMSVDRLAVELRNEQHLDSLGSGTGDRVRQAELAYSTGRLELEQLREKLANERLVSDASINVKALDISIAEKNLNEQRRTLDDARIRAPRKGTLTFINNQIGQKVSEGERVAILSDLSHFKIEGELPDGYADRIAVGAKALVRMGRDRLPGTVSNFTPMSQNGVVSFSV